MSQAQALFYLTLTAHAQNAQGLHLKSFVLYPHIQMPLYSPGHSLLAEQQQLIFLLKLVALLLERFRFYFVFQKTNFGLVLKVLKTRILFCQHPLLHILPPYCPRHPSRHIQLLLLRCDLQTKHPKVYALPDATLHPLQ